MDAPNQVPEPRPDAPIPVPPDPPPTFLPRGLLPWLIAVAAAGAVGLLFNQLELALFTSLAGLFVVAHAADLDPAHLLLYRLVAWCVPVFGAFLFAGLGLAIALPGTWGSGASGLAASSAVRIVAIMAAWGAAALALAMGFPAVGRVMAQWWFRTPVTSHVLRLTTHLSMLGMLLYVPASVLFQGMVEDLVSANQPLIGRGSLWGNLAGLTLLALGAVGYRVRRGGRETLERLGLAPITAPQWVLVGFGVVALMVLNGGSEWAQRTWLPALAEHDHQVTQLITRGLTHSDVLLLGISAGVGEELAIRGALQPRLGIGRSAALFALLHVQYSWFGVLVIFGLGLILGAIRRRTSTSVAILVHTLYDIVAVILAMP